MLTKNSEGKGWHSTKRAEFPKRRYLVRNQTLTCTHRKEGFPGWPHWGRGWTALHLCPHDLDTGRGAQTPASPKEAKDFRKIAQGGLYLGGRNASPQP